MNVALFAAGCLALFAAAAHGGGGQVWVMRRLAQATLPPSRLGGPRGTMAMVHVTWHLLTVALLTVGCALIVSAVALDGDAERAVGVTAAGIFTGFAVVGLGLGAAYSPRSLIRHPGPALFAVTAALAWWGAL